MNISISDNAEELGKKAGSLAIELIQEAILKKGSANIILATGASQFNTLQTLITAPGIDWSKVTMFHLDEYIGLPVTHKASFRKYLTERFINKTGTTLKAACLINGETNPEEECNRLNAIISEHPIDVALVGIGENGHLAFNDPPADFDTEAPYIIVNLDEPCRRQQLNEGWFPTLEDVPLQAISMSIKQIMKSAAIICSVPDERKAVAVKNSIESTVSNLFPASILQQHNRCYFFLDKTSSSLLSTP
ncbi:MAG: glucosamine-6-phosphate deaminase [Chitinophagaceae bacterium]|nr:glucosamine-6-phosphate deaminase [Chitinophagaceae bacterium]MCW5925744.1 glucosamine-6-phosphate deaminase [Chitinophagaceae bacterium]